MFKKLFAFFRRIFNKFFQHFSPYEDADYEEFEDDASSSAIEHIPNKTEPVRTVSAFNLSNNLDQNEFEYYYNRIRSDIENQFEVLHSRHQGANNFRLETTRTMLPKSVRDQLTKDGFLINPSSSSGYLIITLPESEFLNSLTKNTDQHDTGDSIVDEAENAGT